MTTDVRDAYDKVAPEYAHRFLDELAGKPLDRALLDCFAELTRGKGGVLDVGCGPGQIGRYLHDRGVSVAGVDMSPEMVRAARAAHGAMPFTVADMSALPVADGACAGIVAFYAIVNAPRHELARPVAEFYRVLAPGARLLLSFHVGTDHVHLDQWLGSSVSLDFWFFPRALVEAVLEEAGFQIEARLEREPVPEVEYPSSRAYLLARRM